MEFSPRDAAKLAAFNAKIRADVSDKGSFDSHDEAYYARYTGEAGWTLGFEEDGEIVSTYTAIRDLTPFRESWLFPTETKILRSPLVWGANQAVAPQYRSTDLRMRQRQHMIEFLESKGIHALLAAVLPKNARYMFENYRHGRSRMVGIYYDHAGWNHLGARAGTWVDEHAPNEATDWCTSTDEIAMTQIIRAGMISVTARPSDDGYEIGFGPVSQ